MADPFRLFLLKNLTALLAEITPANGYVNDLTDAVFRGRQEFGENDPLPMVSILEVPLPSDQQLSPSGSGSLEGPYDLVVQGFIKDDAENPTDPAHLLLADVQQALAKEKVAHEQEGSALGTKRIEEIIIGKGTVRPPDETSAVAHFWMVLTLRIVEDLDTPYAYLTDD